MQTVGHLTPVAWAMDAFHQLLFYNGGLGDILLPVGVLVAITAVLFGVGILTFRYD
jgi:ABC-type multidrug transport system permease subunit